MLVITYPGNGEHDYRLTFEDDPNVGASMVFTSKENVLTLKCVPTRKELREIKAWLECLGIER